MPSRTTTALRFAGCLLIAAMLPSSCKSKHDSTSIGDASAAVVSSPEARAPSSPPPSASMSASAAASSSAAPVPEAGPSDASAERDPTRRDRRLKDCCRSFDAYATGFVANRGPDMGDIFRRCMGLYTKGYDLAEAEPIIRRAVVNKRYFMPPLCVVSKLAGSSSH